MTREAATQDRIIEGAIRALAQHGLRKLTMRSVCQEAGVSRGTLYRYFDNRDELLEAVAKQVERTSRANLRRAILADPAPERRLEVVLQAVLDYREDFPETVHVVVVEPAFGLSFLTREYPAFVGVVAEALGPVLDEAPPVQDGSLTKRELTELLLRVTTTAIILPSADSGQIARRLAAMWASMIRTPATQGAGQG